MSHELMSDVNNENQLNKRIYCENISNCGVIYMNLHMYPINYSKDIIVYLLNEIITITVQALYISKANGLETFNMEINAEGVKPKHFNMQFAKLIADTLKRRFPDKMGKCKIVNPPTYFEVMFDMFKTFIDKKTQKKIKIEKLK